VTTSSSLRSLEGAQVVGRDEQRLAAAVEQFGAGAIDGGVGLR
jgi:hypothetical protein